MTTSSLQELVEMFAEKLRLTGSMDAALLKVVWVAFKRGVEAGREEYANDQRRIDRA